MIIREKAAVVTGGASGLGEATARALAQAGASVAIFDMDGARAEAVAADIGGIACQVDVTDDQSVKAGFERARNTHGQERILVNCAGRGNAIRTVARSRSTGEITPFPMGAFNDIVQVNLMGTFRCITNAAAGMVGLEIPQGEECGVIVNTASVAAQDGQIGQAAYAAGKAGIVGLTLPVARDLSLFGIRVNTILPGIFDTPLVAAAPKHLREALCENVPFPKRLGCPDEFSQLVLEICRNGYLNGESIRLDGAIRMSAS